MPKRKLSTLGTLVRKKRGEAKLRETANAIGISPATLMRIESGRIPDVETFGKICLWLEVNPGDFLGFESNVLQDNSSSSANQPFSISAHLRADKTPQPETINALANMILLATQSQRGTEELPTHENA